MQGKVKTKVQVPGKKARNKQKHVHQKKSNVKKGKHTHECSANVVTCRLAQLWNHVAVYHYRLTYGRYFC